MKQTLTHLMCILLLSSIAFGGWDVVNDVTESGKTVGKTPNGKLMITTNFGKIKLSSNNGNSWETVGSGYGDFMFYNTIGYLYSYNSMFYSTNNGTSWTDKNLSSQLGSYRISNISLAGGSAEYAWYDSGSVGNLGGQLLYKSVAGTQNWQKVSFFPTINKYTSGTPQKIAWCRSICFLDANTGWAVGDSLSKNDVIFKTNNGGNSWTRVSFANYSSGNRITKINFIDASNGWILVNDAKLYKTTDGGNSWLLKQLPETDMPIVSLNFLDANYGFCKVMGSRDFRTTNGGNTWVEFTPPGNKNVYFDNAFEGYIASDNNLYRSSDGGQTWQSQTLGFTPQVNFAGLNSVKFFDNTKGWVAGDRADAGINIARTENGGTTWINKSLPDVYNNWYINNGAFCDNSTAYFVCDSGSNTSGNTCKGAIFKTSNGGNSYSKLNISAINSANWSLYGAKFYDNNNGYFAGYADNSSGVRDGLILKTTNGGTTWIETIIPKTGNKNFWFFDIAQPQSNLAWAITGGWDDTEGQVYKTSNNGQSWQSQLLPQITENKGLLSTCFISANEGWVAGKLKNNNSNCILKTVDGGANWSVINIDVGAEPLMNNIYKITFVNSSVGWLAGNNYYNYYIYKTTNGGLSWQLQKKQSSSYNWMGLSFVNENVGWAVSGDLVLKTTNGGNVGINDYELKDDLTLLSNYPNPFNPITTITYKLYNSGLTKLTIYNAKGQLIKTLVNGNQPAGKHTINFDANGLNSGVYYYKLESEGKSVVNKMLLVK